MMEIRTDALVAVIGAGALGAEIVRTAAAVGYPVTVVDGSAGSFKKARAMVGASLAKSVGHRKPAALDKAAIENRIGWPADLVQRHARRL